MSVSLLVTLFIGLVYGQSNNDPFVWPLPSSFTVSPTLDLNLNHSFNITTTSTSTILQKGIWRYMNEIIFTHIPDKTPPSTSLISSLLITVKSSDENILQYDVDESYTLTLSSSNNVITANTVYGALKGLETLSQLVVYNYTVGYYQAFSCIIKDSPRFSWRGILVDTSRHYLTISAIKSLLNSMSFAKLNVLHWHIVDTQSFPYQSEIYAKLIKGAYGPYQRYSLNDIRQIVQYGKERGIRIVPEFDIPGHTMSWCPGYPEICPNPDCNKPNGEADKPDGILNPATNTTYEFIEKLFSEASSVFFDNYFHIGGDEVELNCWAQTPSIVSWEKENNFTDTEALLYFDLRALDIVNYAVKRKPIQWDDMYTKFKNDVSNNLTTIHVWHDANLLAQITGNGYQGILSPNAVWYLDNTHQTWQNMYSLEPLQYINNSLQSKLVLGGEACMWGESVDTSNIEQTIWPRAAAVAERLWSPRDVRNNNTAEPRYAYFRCLLNQRGVDAAPYNNTVARSNPHGPGSCYNQR